MFEKGKYYTRDEVCEILHVPVESRKGHWYTGYTSYNGNIFIFANIDAAGRTGHNYNNHWLPDGSLYWRGKTTSSINTPMVKRMLLNESPVYIFTRNDNRELSFQYRGLGKVVSFKDETPVQITWNFE